MGAKANHLPAPVLIPLSPRPAAASPEHQAILANKAVEPKQTLDTLVPALRMDEKCTENASANTWAVSTATNPILEPLGPTKSDTPSPQKPKFLVAQQEYQDLFASMAIRAKQPSIVSLTPSIPLPAETTAAPTPVPPPTIEVQEAVSKQNAIPTPDVVATPLKYKFAVARPEYYDILASMRVGVKNTPSNSSVPADLPPTKRLDESVGGLSKATDKPLLPHQRTKTTALNMSITVEPPPTKRTQEVVEEMSKATSKPSPVLTTPRHIISQHHTSPPTSSSSKHQPTTSTASPKTELSSAGSSPGSSPPRRRPQTTDLVARRLIGAALGIKVSMKRDEKTTVIQNAMKMKGRGERKAIWDNYAACVEN